MGILSAFIAVIILILVPWAGVGGLGLAGLFGVIIPYGAIALFFCGIIIRVVRWSMAPNPFRIPTTGGQQAGLHGIRQSRFDNPFTTFQVMGRMAFEVLLFRSLFRNLSLRVKSSGQGVTYASAKWLWLFAIFFHYAMLITVFRHLRFFVNPVPWPVRMVENMDGWLQTGIPAIMISGLLLIAALIFLLIRRIVMPKLRYISLMNDFFPLFLLAAIAGTGALMRYVTGTDITSVKQLAMGLISFDPVVSDGIGSLFFIHIFLVSFLLAYFPFSKLMHAAGIFFSPTRDLANNSRAVRHENPWNYPVRFHTYEAYEKEFGKKMTEAGIPLDHPPETSAEKEQKSGQ